MKTYSYLIIFTLLMSPFSAVLSNTAESNDEFLEHQLNRYHLSVLPHQVTYRYKTEVVPAKGSSFALPDAVEELAKSKYSSMNNSPLFDVKFILQPQKVRSYQTKKKHYQYDVGSLMKFRTQDDVELDATYFDRGSDTLIVIGPGFTNERERMAPFTHLFTN